jgi:hypothetical protein
VSTHSKGPSRSPEDEQRQYLGRARKYESGDRGSRSFLEQVQSSGYVSVHKILVLVRHHVRFVQRRGMEDRIDAAHAIFYEIAVGNRSEALVWRIKAGSQ